MGSGFSMFSAAPERQKFWRHKNVLEIMPSLVGDRTSPGGQKHCVLCLSRFWTTDIVRTT